MATNIFTIEARLLDLVDAGVAGHDFWVLKDSQGTVIGELHGLATDRQTDKPIAIGDINDSLRFYHYYPSNENQFFRSSGFISSDQPTRLIFAGTQTEVMARWNSAVNAIPTLNNLDLDYTPFGFIGSPVINSNAAYTVFGNLMDVPVHNFSGFWEPGFGNLSQILTPSQIDSLQYHPPIIGAPSSQFNLNINPNILTPKFETPTDPTQSVSADNSTLLSTGSYKVTGVGNVNAVKGAMAWINDTITAGLRPGNDNLSTNTVSIHHLSLSAPDLGASIYGIKLDANGINNATNRLKLFAPTDPLILDLNGNGVKLTDYGSNPVLFDIDHDGGTLEQTGWVSAQDGIVVYDLNGNGKIDDISETLSEYFNGTVGIGGNGGQKKYANGLVLSHSCNVG